MYGCMEVLLISSLVSEKRKNENSIDIEKYTVSKKGIIMLAINNCGPLKNVPFRGV